MENNIKHFSFCFRILIGKILTDFLFKLTSRKININNIERNFFLFNRADLIGDAIVTLPFFLSLKKAKIKFKVLCSDYNKWVLEPFVDIEIINVKNETFKEKLWHLIKFPSIYLKKRKKRKEKLKNFFFDLVGSSYVSKQYYKDFFCIHCKSSITNLIFSDYVIDDYYVTFGKKHLIEKYKIFFEKIGVNLYIEEFPKELDKYISQNHDPEIEKVIDTYKRFIIVYIGNKDYRNFSPNEWKDIIENINYDGYILVIDDKTNSRANILKRLIKKKNVRIIKNKYNLWTLMYLAKYSDWVIGIDGGGFNFLQIPTNAIGIYFYTNVNTWKPYSNKPYFTAFFDKEKNIKVIKSITSQKKNKVVIFVNENDYIKAYYEKYKIRNKNIINRLKNFILNQDILNFTKNSFF